MLDITSFYFSVGITATFVIFIQIILRGKLHAALKEIARLEKQNLPDEKKITNQSKEVRQIEKIEYKLKRKKIEIHFFREMAAGSYVIVLILVSYSLLEIFILRRDPRLEDFHVLLFLGALSLILISSILLVHEIKDASDLHGPKRNSRL